MVLGGDVRKGLVEQALGLVQMRAIAGREPQQVAHPRGVTTVTGFFERALYAYTIYGAAITPCLVAALFWKRATSWGAVASIVSGIAVTLTWEEVGIIKESLPAAVSTLDAVLPAITVSVIALIVVSLLTCNNKATDKD